MPTSSFHIAIDGPVGTSYASFPSSVLENGDTDKILLSMIRNKSAIPNKFFFTVDGKSRIDDDTTLAYYMSLTGDGQEILSPGSSVKKSEAPANGEQKSQAEGDKNAANGVEKVNGEKVAPKPAEPKLSPGVHTLNVQVTDGKTAKSLLALPKANEGLSKLLDSISTSSLKRGTMPTFADRSLSVLSDNYAATASSKSYTEPMELDGTQWHSIFLNNRVFHGYYFDYKMNVLVKARKRAFKLAGAAPVGMPANNVTKAEQTNIPAIPPFYIDDDATVDVTEIRSQFQHTLFTEGFNSLAVSGNFSAASSKIAGSVSASFEQEHSEMNQSSQSSNVESIVTTYNFPRCVVELDPDCLELTDECHRAAVNVTDQASKGRFFRDYGLMFATKFTLGGYLHSTRNVSSTEQSSLSQIKDQTRSAAGLSIQTPWASGELNVAKVNMSGKEEGSASLLQSARLTWEARGGDTVLCSNPPAWASTVKDYKLWRLMKQHRLVTLEGLIKDIDALAWNQLDSPSAVIKTSGDVVKDNEKARQTLMNAILEPENNAIAQKMEKFYHEGKFEQAANIEKYNTWFKANFPTEAAAIIPAGLLYGGVSPDQRIGFGLWMASLKQIALV